MTLKKLPWGLMTLVVILIVAVLTWISLAADGTNEKKMLSKTTQGHRQLTAEEENVIVHKGTEAPFTGEYYKHSEAGSYLCKRCGAELFSSSHKFESECGWPSFDDALPGAVKEVPDADGRRTEIVCAACGGHLGHVFVGEQLTAKNVRHCVNSISLDFSPAAGAATATAYFAGGCFWGVEHFMARAEGVISARSGYMGGATDNPEYRQVCEGITGHAEAVEVIFDPAKTDFETIARLFFEIHDPTQVNRQGPDVGSQYRSAVFYVNDEQRETSERLVDLLKNNGYAVATELVKAGKFWPAEAYHQNYYQRSGQIPYCHTPVKRF